jgi:hypothetical protein
VTNIQYIITVVTLVMQHWWEIFVPNEFQIILLSLQKFGWGSWSSFGLWYPIKLKGSHDNCEGLNSVLETKTKRACFRLMRFVAAVKHGITVSSELARRRTLQCSKRKRRDGRLTWNISHRRSWSVGCSNSESLFY